MKAKLPVHQVIVDTYNGISGPGIRWNDGIPHHQESIQLMNELMILDFEFGGDFFCFKAGGDGDNGEHLMYLLDMIFERRGLKT